MDGGTLVILSKISSFMFHRFGVFFAYARRERSRRPPVTHGSIFNLEFGGNRDRSDSSASPSILQRTDIAAPTVSISLEIRGKDLKK